MQKQLLIALFMVAGLFAQAQKSGEEGAKAKQEDKNPSFRRELSLEAKTETKSEITIKGQKVPYGTRMAKPLPACFMYIMKEPM
jgi:hypothetical protein